MTPSHPTSMIIAERGSAWAAWVERLQREGANVVVLQQDSGETAARFALRVRARVADLASNGAAPSRAVLVGGGRSDRDMVAARSLAIRAIAQEMGRHGGGHVLLEDAGNDRFSMAALASTVQMLLGGTGVHVAHRPDARVAA